jgi:hypothetical protein
MKNCLRIALYFLPLFTGHLMFAQGNKEIAIRFGKIKLDFTIDDNGSAFYAVQYKEQPVILKSELGFILADNIPFHSNFELIGVDSTTVDSNWKPAWGEVSSIRNNYKELTLQLRQKDASAKLLNIVFRLFEDGIGFRYTFPKQSNLRYFVIKDELTRFRMAGNHKVFWIPGDYDTNEYTYSTTRISEIDNRPVVAAGTDIAVRLAPDLYSVQTPLMLKTDNGLYINIHEAALAGYSAMQLHTDIADYSFTSSLVPDATGNKAYLKAPGSTPWRTIIVSNDAKEILASKMILNLNEPSVESNTTWIKPMKFVGVWWEMQTGKSTWNYSDFPDSTDKNGLPIPNGKHGANTANVKMYIDFAAANGIGGVLVEGWNIGWEDWFGNWKEKVFDFTKPYPDFDIIEITRYAASKGVEMIMHNETSGSATDYERQLDTAYRFMNLFGYKSVKTGYVGKIVPRGEHHDGQWMNDHYIRVARKALQHHVMVDMHEQVRPTGLHRTYPNWISAEAARGNEFNAFSKGSPPEHETILPFTRLMGGPMDYTPGIFKLKGYSASDTSRQLHSTLAKQLALYITIYSPLQMVADYPKNYALYPEAFQFIKDVATDWDDTKILEAEPGDYVTIARKAKGTENWFIGSVTDENKRTALIPLSFLEKGKKYVASIYQDATDADWKSNPEAHTIRYFYVNATSILKLPLANGGGAAISIRPAMAKESRSMKTYK